MHTIPYNSLNCDQYRHNSVGKHNIILHYYSMFWCGVSGVSCISHIFATYILGIFTFYRKYTDKTTILFGEFDEIEQKMCPLHLFYVPSALILGVIGRKMAYIRPVYNMHKGVNRCSLCNMEKFRGIFGWFLCNMTNQKSWNFLLDLWIYKKI